MEEDRSRLRDWEAGKERHGALVAVVKRSTWFMLANPIKCKTKKETTNALLRILPPLPEAYTRSPDNGREFSGSASQDHAPVRGDARASSRHRGPP